MISRDKRDQSAGLLLGIEVAQSRDWLWLLMFCVVSGALGCFSDLKGDLCTSNVDCFRNEQCVDGACQLVALSNSGTTVTEDTGMSVDEDPIPTGSGFISGIVFYQGSSEGQDGVIPIAGALVSTEPQSEQVLSNMNGEYQIGADLTVGTVYALSVRKDRYVQDGRLTVTVKEGGNRNFDILMRKCDATETLCDGADEDCDGSVDEGLLNACDGCMPLSNNLGDGCEMCGRFVCDDEDPGSLVCSGAVSDDELNACGGCLDLPEELGESCGDLCGRYACDDEDPDILVCSGERALSELNACGGCEELGGEVGDPCGTCGVYRCMGQEALECDRAAQEICGNGHDDNCLNGVDEDCDD